MTNALPVIVSGPILRRVTTSQVYVWIATSARYRIDGKLYHLSPSIGACSAEPLEVWTKTSTVRGGERLYITMIKLIPKQGTLPEQTLLGYNLTFSRGETTFDLGRLGLLDPEAPDAIVYGHLPYPSFHIDRSEQTSWLYGSCRKPHGEGEDALAAGDSVLEKHHADPRARPGALFMTGDQIYADDVADPLFPVIQQAGTALFGDRRESLEELEPSLKQEPLRSGMHQIHGRQFLSEHLCRFTSGEAANHLLSMPDYAAMYCLCWGPQLWDVALPAQGDFLSFEEALEQNRYYFVYPDEPRHRREHKTERAQHRKRYRRQLARLREFRRTLPRVRRLLANIPTYMIFDDHEVTDDWNLSADWTDSVHSSPLGKQVITNALSAYWVFQGWGNHPRTFGNRFIQSMKRYLGSYKVGSTRHEHWQEQLWSFDSWCYVAPTYPRALVLDTRTMRAFDDTPEPVRIGRVIDENRRGPQLIGARGWKRTTKRLLANGWSPGMPLAIVSPAPLYGLGLVESTLHKYVYPLRAIGLPVHKTLDYEAWKYNGKGFGDFLHHLREWAPDPCVILSGDVHYSYAVKSKVRFGPSREQLVHQYTVSPFKNMSFGGLWGMLLRLAMKFNSLKRSHRSIRRWSDASHRIYRLEESTLPDEARWHESIRYTPLTLGRLVETRNTLGKLRINLVEHRLQSELLQQRQGRLKRRSHPDTSLSPRI